MSDYSVFPSLAATIIALCAVLVSGFVAYIQKRNLDLALFDRRFSYYQRLQEFMRYTRSRKEDPEIEMRFLEETKKAEFLFPKQAAQAIHKIWSLGVEHRYYIEQLSSPEEEERNEARKERAELRKKLELQVVEFQKHAEKRMRFGL